MSSTIKLDVPTTQSTKVIKPLLIVIAVGLLMAVGFVAYIWFSGAAGQPSTATTAPILVRQPNDTRSLFRILPDDSEVRFIIDETLLNQPKTVIGTTRQIAGDLLIDFETPANSEMSAVRINVRTLETDNEFRNRALRGQVLQADRPEFEFAEFIPVALIGLPEGVTIGDAFTFQIKGNLTIHGVTREVIFDVSITPISKTRLEGSAQASVMYRDFNMSIPEAPGVANISDVVHLEIDFVAQASS